MYVYCAEIEERQQLLFAHFIRKHFFGLKLAILKRWGKERLFFLNIFHVGRGSQV
jgi:hypothetical protein